MDDLKNDIEKYLRGELPEAQMHALEKRALDDPFLADALEGASDIDSHAFAGDMSMLRQQLNARVSRKKVIPLWIWTARIAAGLLVIAVATYIVISLQESPSRSSQSTAYQADEKIPEPGSPNDTLQNSPGGNYLSLNDAKKESKATESEEAAAPRPAAKPQTVSPAEPADPAEAQTLAKADTDAEQPDEDQPIVDQETRRADVAKEAAEPPETEAAERYKALKKEAPSVAAAPSAAPPRDIRTKAREMTAGDTKQEVIISSGYYDVSRDSVATNSRFSSLHMVTGRVTSSDDGTGLPGVNVIIKGTSTGTVTDIRGNYQLPVSDPATTLVFSFIGMESHEVPVNAQPVVNVALTPDAAELSEVVVVGYGEGKDAEEKIPTFDMAEPAGGKRAFKKYLEEKMVYPQEALDNKIEGRVTVQFTVETTGQISNLNVIKGIGYGCDDELIRLIKNGPRWSPMKRDDEPVRGRVRVRMRFTLPKKK